MSYIVWLLTAVLAAKVSIVGVAVRVAVLEPPQSYREIRSVADTKDGDNNQLTFC